MNLEPETLNLPRYILQNIRHYYRSWLLTIAGAVIGTAVLTGAFITGDSVKYSLRELVRMRLGETRYALAPADRYFRKALAGEMAAASGFVNVPLLQTRGIVTEPGRKRSINLTEIIGITPDFMKLWPGSEIDSGFRFPSRDEAVISRNVADRLEVSPGDFIVVKIPREGFAPANAPFVSELSETTGLRLKIKAIANDHSGGRFSLRNNQSAPFNIFISQDVLASGMGIKGFVNALLIDPRNGQTVIDSMGRLLQRLWTPEDAGLQLIRPAPGIFQINSRRIFIEDTLASVIRAAVPEANGVFSYLVNDISVPGKSTPYSFVTATSQGITPDQPGSGEIVFNDWLALDLNAKPRDLVTLRYWVMGPNRSLREATAQFRVKSIVPVENSEVYRTLMPDFPGMKNTGSCRDWETGTPVDLTRIRDKDETYWNQYKGTPKAWISLKEAQEIWQNPFGSYTAFRFSDSASYGSITTKLRNLDPRALGLVFLPVFEEGVYAAGNSTDFGELFLSLGGLIVIAGLMLSGMLFSLFILQRIEEMTLLRALGFRNRKIMTVFLAESMVVTVLGGMVGMIAAIGYSQLIVSGLNTLWTDAVNTSGLIIDIRSSSLITGFLSSLILNMIIFIFILYRNRNRSLPSPYQQPSPDIPKHSGFLKISGIVMVVVLFAVSTMIILVETISGRFYPSPVFMLSGVLSMAGAIGGIALFLARRNTPEPIANTGILGHALKNATLRRNRTITAITLLALGTFTVLVTGLNRKAGNRDEYFPGSGTGGFRLWMETTIPLMADLNTPDGKKRTGLDDEPLPRNIRFVPLPEVPGDDASCLNLNQTAQPSLKGVPTNLFDHRESFSFVNLEPGISRDHPWKALDVVDHPGCINGFADQTVIIWGLRLKIGDTLRYRDEGGRRLNIRLAGGLANSVFQGSILISDSLLRVHFPASARVRSLLVDLPDGGDEKAIRILGERLRDQGAVITPAAERLATFEAVENTYLDVFLMLGGLGLIIGTAGLAVMVMRSLRDRRRELALYAALGFPSGLIYRLIAGEFLFILLAGITSGTVSAFVGTLPSVLGRDPVNLIFPLVLVGVVLINGLIWIHFPVRRTTRSTNPR